MRKVLSACLLAAAALGLPAQVPEAHRPASLAQTQPLLWTRMSEDITRLASEVDGRVGVYVRDLETGASFSLRGDEVFPAASTIKLAILLELYRQAQGGPGQASLADAYVLQPGELAADSALLGNLSAGTRLTNRDLALFTIVVSDNSASNILMDRVGMARVNATLDGLGLPKTRLRRRMMDLQAVKEGRENHATPRDLAELLAAIHQGPLLNPASRADLLGLLRTPKEGYLTRLLPEELSIANKPGSLPGVRNDVGLLTLRDKSFVVAVMTSHLRDERQGEAAIARIALRAATCFDAAGATSPEGRLLRPLLIH